MLALLVAIGIAAGDQWSKEWVRQTLALHEVRPVLEGFFHLTYVRNTGAAWGMFGGGNSWLILFSAVMLVLMVVFRRSFLRDSLLHRLALGMLAGGILGNLFDRVRLGYVTDFLSFHFGRYEFPSFNVADSGITVGVILYIVSSFLDELRGARRTHVAGDGPDAAPSDAPSSPAGT